MPGHNTNRWRLWCPMMFVLPAPHKLQLSFPVDSSDAYSNHTFAHKRSDTPICPDVFYLFDTNSMLLMLVLSGCSTTAAATRYLCNKRYWWGGFYQLSCQLVWGKGKKESKKSCKNYLEVTDFEQIWFMISTLSQTLIKRWAQERAQTTTLKCWCQVRSASARSSALPVLRFEAV